MASSEPSLDTAREDKRQAITWPEHCLGCKAKRLGIQEGRAVYDCHTEVRFVRLTGKLHVKRTATCFAAQREATEARRAK
jgi:hypothetical protein